MMANYTMKPQLFLLHFAGGNCYSLQFLSSMLTKFELIGLELPGRGDRINENLLKDFDLAAIDIYNQINQRLVSNNNFLIYGHSLGAYLALRVTGMLERMNRKPMHLIVSGSPGPGVIRENKLHYLLGKEEFIVALKEMGGIPIEVIENKELFDFFEPILRADFEIAEKKLLNSETAINTPIYALMGSEEERVGKILNWTNFTLSTFNFEILEGNHFFIYKHAKRIAEIITSCYENAVISSNNK
jgi:external thioesterase TEII